jgi:hypothetical protein
MMSNVCEALINGADSVLITRGFAVGMLQGTNTALRGDLLFPFLAAENGIQ